MTAISQFVQGQKNNRAFQESEVLKISQRIASKIEVQPEEIDSKIKFNYPLKKYRIIKTHRCFNEGWIDLFEINPIQCKGDMGYSNGDNAKWIEGGGTTTTNLPPKDEIEKFFVELDDYLNPKPKQHKSILSKIMDFLEIKN